MIKRPIDPRFADAVRTGRKFTTIRAKPWPVGVPIMLYHWAGKPYRSKQVDVAVVIVKGFWSIRIAQSATGEMAYDHGMQNPKPIHETEGFESQAEMDAWFRKLVKPCSSIGSALMRFNTAPAFQL